MVSVLLQGGMCNNLFQICAVLGHSLRYGLEYCVPDKVKWPHYEGQKVFYSPNINYCNEELNLHTYNEKDFSYSEIPAIDDVIFQGYFQSYKYFIDYIDVIRELLNIDCSVKRKIVALHVRRGNYLQKKKFHPPVTMDYLEKALVYYYAEHGIKEFRVFSDDMNWCLENVNEKKFPHLEFEYSYHNDEVEDFKDMIGCEHFITSNSTFGLMAAILNNNPDKLAVSPENWFGESGQYNNTKDLYLPGTILL